MTQNGNHFDVLELLTIVGFTQPRSCGEEIFVIHGSLIAKSAMLKKIRVYQKSVGKHTSIVLKDIRLDLQASKTDTSPVPSLSR